MKKIHFINLNGREVQVMSVVELFGESSGEIEVITDLLNDKTLLPNHCAQNARIIMVALNEYYGHERVKYVEGTAIGEDGEEIAHCWNLIDGKYFDVTLDVFAHYEEFDYYARRIFNTEQMIRFDHIGYATISFAGSPDKDYSYKYWFDNKGRLCKSKMTLQEKEETIHVHKMIEEKVNNYLNAA